jgi:flagellar M-ring protein FliF
MRNQVTGALTRLQRSFASFTVGQKVTAVIGAAALVLAAFLTFQWASAPSYVPLFNNLAPADASAIVDQLESEGTPYELADGGGTVLVPREVVYDTRIRLSGEGLPADDSSGYALLDGQELSTSQFQEETNFKRAMEGELSDTIEALEGVNTAVVHLAMPQEEIFADEQEPTTASVLVETQPGTTMQPEQVQAVVHLVSSSIEGLEPDNVTVADASGQVLSAPGDTFNAAGDSQAQQVESFEERMTASVQQMLDRVLGPGRSVVEVTADLNFDKTVTNTVRYFADPDAPAEAETQTTETYTAPGGQAAADGVVGPDGALDPAAAPGEDAQEYTKRSRTSDNLVNRTVEQREAAPGSVSSLHVGVVMDTQASSGVQARTVEDLVNSTLGLDQERGDSLEVSVLPFDRSAEEAAETELAAAEAAEKKAEMMSMARTGAVVLLVIALLVGAWLRGRKRNKARAQATTYVVEQLRQQTEQRERPAIDPTAAAAAALEAAPPAPAMPDTSAVVRDEIAALVERQPEEVAQLLRGWLVDHEPRR